MEKGFGRLSANCPRTRRTIWWAGINFIDTANVYSEAQIALSWLLHQAVVTSVIIGAKTPQQQAENLAAPEVKLTDDELSRLAAVSELPAEYPGWMIQRLSLYRFPEPPADE